MKVKKLIKLLKTFEPDMKCVVSENLAFTGVCHPVTNIFAEGFRNHKGEEFSFVVISAQDLEIDKDE